MSLWTIIPIAGIGIGVILIALRYTMFTQGRQHPSRRAGPAPLATAPAQAAPAQPTATRPQSRFLNWKRHYWWNVLGIAALITFILWLASVIVSVIKESKEREHVAQTPMLIQTIEQPGDNFRWGNSVFTENIDYRYYRANTEFDLSAPIPAERDAMLAVYKEQADGGVSESPAWMIRFNESGRGEIFNQNEHGEAIPLNDDGERGWYIMRLLNRPYATLHVRKVIK